MAPYEALSINELSEIEKSLEARLKEYKNMNLKLDMSRGKPCSEQLDNVVDILDILNSKSDFIAEDGIDCRNYGDLAGIPEARKFFAEMFEVGEKEIIVGGNSSLNLMYDTILRAMLFGVPGSQKPWSSYNRAKFLCPSPGYDRHFAICKGFGIEMIPIKMNLDGPDMDQVEKYVSSDESIKGIWCVPKYSNPEGMIFSDKVVDRLASMKTKATDFRIMWDNSYVVHSITDEDENLKNILVECKKEGNQNRVLIFGSTSKITITGAGVSIVAASEENIEHILKQISLQTIGFDKINQLRHVRYLKDMNNVKEIMKKHASIIKPKFDAVFKIFEKELSDKQIAEWTKPKGGYFISFNTMDGCAKDIVNMAKDTGIVVTPAGVTFPYGIDPHDRNIRIAPTYPAIEQLKTAIEVFCVCVKLVSIRKLKEKLEA